MRARIALIVAVLSVAGCTSHPGSVAGPAGVAPAGTASPAPKSFDPPLRFRTDRSVHLPATAASADAPLPALLDKTTLVVAAPDRLQVVDALTGTVRATAKPPHESTGTSAAAPLLAQVDGHTVAVAAFVVTAAARRAVDVLAVDIATGQTAWSMPVEANADAAVPVGVHDHTLLLRAGANTYAVDLAARTVMWSRPLAADLVVGDIVVGGGADGAVALAVSDGRQRWAARKGAATYVRSGGPNLIVATGGSEGAYFFDLLDPATGTPRYSSGGGGSGALRCRYDEQAVTVCWQEVNGSRWVGGFDPTTGQALWQLPDTEANRDAPTVTDVWHGAVYGSTSAGPVVLDAHTGADRNTSPGVAPYLVDKYVGVARSGTTLTAHPTAG